MQRMPQWFRPTLAASVFFLLLLAPQALLEQSVQTITMSSSMREETRITTWGVPPLVEQTYRAIPGAAPATVTEVHYGMIALVLLGVVVIALPLGRLISGPHGMPPFPGREHPARTLLMVILATASLAFIAAISISRAYWGYWFTPPPLDPRVVNAASIVSHSAFDTTREKDGTLRCVLAPSLNLNKRLPWIPAPGYSRDSDYSFREREEDVFRQRGLLNTDAAGFPTERLANLHSILDRTGLLLGGSKGYADAKLLSGRVWELKSADHQPLLFVSAQGREVSNDHYPYYEILFDNANPDNPVLLSHNRFFYDVAGFEGVTALRLFAGFTILALIPTMIATVLVMALRRWPLRFRDRRGFPITPINS